MQTRTALTSLLFYANKPFLCLLKHLQRQGFGSGEGGGGSRGSRGAIFEEWNHLDRVTRSLKWTSTLKSRHTQYMTLTSGCFLEFYIVNHLTSISLKRMCMCDKEIGVLMVSFGVVDWCSVYIYNWSSWSRASLSYPDRVLFLALYIHA